MRVGLYIDAFNVYYGGRSLCGCGKPGWRWLHLAGLAMDLLDPRLWPDAELTRFVYCTALRDREGDPSSVADQKTYIAALHEQTLLLTVVNGVYAARTKTGVIVERASNPRRVISPGVHRIPGWLPVAETRGPDGNLGLLATVSTFEEKGSDVNVASHLLIDVLTGAVDAAIVFSNDSDLRVPLEEARLRVPVGTVNPGVNPTARSLRGERDAGAGRHWWRRLAPDDLLSHQLQDPVGQLSKPVGW